MVKTGTSRGVGRAALAEVPSDLYRRRLNTIPSCIPPRVALLCSSFHPRSMSGIHRLGPMTAACSEMVQRAREEHTLESASEGWGELTVTLRERSPSCPYPGAMSTSTVLSDLKNTAGAALLQRAQLAVGRECVEQAVN